MTCQETPIGAEWRTAQRQGNTHFLLLFVLHSSGIEACVCEMRNPCPIFANRSRAPWTPMGPRSHTTDSDNVNLNLIVVLNTGVTIIDIYAYYQCYYQFIIAVSVADWRHGGKIIFVTFLTLIFVVSQLSSIPSPKIRCVFPPSQECLDTPSRHICLPQKLETCKEEAEEDHNICPARRG